MSGYRNLTASQEARRRAHQRDPARADRSGRPAAPDVATQPCALALTLALWRELTQERPGGLTTVDVTRVAVERWGEIAGRAALQSTTTLLESGMLRQVGRIIVRDRGRETTLPTYAPVARWHG